MDAEDRWVEQHYTSIIWFVHTVIRAARQSIRFTHGRSRTVMEGVIESREEKGPPCLPPVEILRRPEIFQIFVIRPDLNWMLGAFEEMAPLLKTSHHCKQLLVMHLIVALHW